MLAATPHWAAVWPLMKVAELFRHALRLACTEIIRQLSSAGRQGPQSRVSAAAPGRSQRAARTGSQGGMTAGWRPFVFGGEAAFCLGIYLVPDPGFFSNGPPARRRAVGAVPGLPIQHSVTAPEAAPSWLAPANEWSLVDTDPK